MCFGRNRTPVKSWVSRLSRRRRGHEVLPPCVVSTTPIFLSPPRFPTMFGIRSGCWRCRGTWRRNGSFCCGHWSADSCGSRARVTSSYSLDSVCSSSVYEVAVSARSHSVSASASSSRVAQPNGFSKKARKEVADDGKTARVPRKTCPIPPIVRGSPPVDPVFSDRTRFENTELRKRGPSAATPVGCEDGSKLTVGWS